MNPKAGARLTATAAVAAAFVAGVLLGQTRSAFEVASVRAATPFTMEDMRSGRAHVGAKIEGTHLDFGAVSLRDLLLYSFRAKDYQMVQPDWTRSSSWNILANLPANKGSADAPDMMRALLQERFKLTVHREKREQTVYQLVVASGGLKIETGDPKAAQVWDGSFPGFRFGGMLRGDDVISGRIIDQPNCRERWEYVPLTMDTLADALTMFMDKPVVDMTGAKGLYKVALDIDVETQRALDTKMSRGLGIPPPGAGGDARGGGTKGGPAGGPPPPPPPGGQGMMACMQSLGDSEGSTKELFKAVQKLGLELRQTKAPVDTIIVDHLEKTPTEN